MNGAACGRRLASPVRLTLASTLGNDIDGAWWPRTAALAHELAELIDALRRPLGEVMDISVNWSSLDGSPDLNFLNSSLAQRMPGRGICHQRMMTVIGSDARANLLVVPCQTNNALALMVLRQAAALPVEPGQHDTQTFQTADRIVCKARTESALQRLRTARSADVDAS
jgi:hypothetical protein